MQNKDKYSRKADVILELSRRKDVGDYAATPSKTILSFKR